tara:strand:- start:15625 stop:15813 length:189 start_codon:yes stop_codon:yes gene_type:complete
MAITVRTPFSSKSKIMLIIFKAFPVLCRILTELKLLSTPVGIITLASGVGDDVVGWVCKFCA